MGVDQPLHVVILAAGKGSRMATTRPKVLNTIAGVPMLERVIRTADLLTPHSIHVVYGDRGAEVRAGLAHLSTKAQLHWIEQSCRLGTGHAVLTALPSIPDTCRVLILLGDVPIIRLETLTHLLNEARAQNTLAVLTAHVPEPEGYGRILRAVSTSLDTSQSGPCVGIVEESDASPEQRGICEINSGIMTAPAALLQELLQQCKQNNAQGEFYLTDIVGIAARLGRSPVAVPVTRFEEVAGVNTLRQLIACDRWYQRDQADRLIDAGVRVIDPDRIDVRGELGCGRDVWIDINCVFEGRVILGDGCHIEPGCVLKDCEIGPGVSVLAFSHLDGVRAETGVVIGPYARLRPGTCLEAGSRVGNFVELKKTRLGPRSKVNHLSYVGDATIGRDVNIGAGTITCNYDGVRKHATEIGDGVFVGSNTELVAPVRLGDGSVVAAGTTVTSNVDSDTLVISRVTQQTVAGWSRRRTARDPEDGD